MRRTAQLLCPSTVILAFVWVRWQRSANPQECEEIGHKLSPFLMSALYRPFRAAEVDAARWEAGLGQATRQQQPVAVWLVGPSAAGKSYLTHDVAKGFGIAFLPTDEPNAVLLDGSSFRNWHSGYQAVIQEGRRLHCVWRAAYPAMRSRLRHEKSRLLRRATRDRLNVLIPHTCDYLSECAPLLYFLHRRGYTNHVVMVLGDREIIRKRGLRRARTTGKKICTRRVERISLQRIAHDSSCYRACRACLDNASYPVDCEEGTASRRFQSSCCPWDS